MRLRRFFEDGLMRLRKAPRKRVFPSLSCVLEAKFPLDLSHLCFAVFGWEQISSRLPHAGGSRLTAGKAESGGRAGRAGRVPHLWCADGSNIP